MDLLALADFNLVARHGGFGAAARASGRPKATLSRHVAELENAMGVRLLERGGRVLKLSGEGRVLHERTSPLLGEVDDVVDGIVSGSARPRGRLRISAPVLFASAAMGTLAAGFALRYPEVQLDVTAEDRNVDMVEEAIDLVIRVNPQPDADLVGRCFLRDRLVIAAAPGIVRPKTGAPVRAVMLGAADASIPWRTGSGAGRSEWMPEPALRLSSLFMVRDAVLAGAGAALLPLSMVSRDVARGALVDWGEADGRPVELWALYASKRLLSRKVTAFLAFLAEAFPDGTSEELAAFIARPRP